MPGVAKKTAKKKLVVKKQSAAAKKRAEEAARKKAEEERWSSWERRLTSIAVSLVCVAGIINELFFEENPREAVLVFLGTILGLPVVISGARKVGEEG